MATLFNTLPKHGTVFNLFQQQSPLPQPQGFATASMSPNNEDLSGMDESFGLPDASLDAFHDQEYDDEEEKDMSFATTASFNSPLSPPSFQQIESSPYGMDICSPSPGHPLYGKRIVPQNYRVDSGSKAFGQYLAPPLALMPTARNQAQGGLLQRLTANVEDNSFSPMSVGSLKSTGSNRGSTGKVGSIKSISSMKDNDAASKARARSRAALPSSWVNHSRTRLDMQSPHAVFEQQQTESPVDDSPNVEDVSMDDAMEVDSPLAARRPPKAHVRPRPLSLFISPPVHAPSPLFNCHNDLEDSPPRTSVLSGDQDQFAAHFMDTPEPATRTAMPLFLNNDGSSVAASPFQRPLSSAAFGRSVEESPFASPSAQKYERCLSAGIAPSASSASLAGGFPSMNSGSNRAPLSANPLLKKTSASSSSTRIPSLKNKTLHRPGLSTLLHSKGNTEAREAHSASAIPSVRMSSLNPRRAVSAFIQPDQVHSATFSGQPSSNLRTVGVGSRLGSHNAAKGRVVSMLLPNTSTDDADESSGAESRSRGLGSAHRRMKSNSSSIRDAAVGYQTGSMRARSAHQQQHQPQVNEFGMLAIADPSPLRPLLPFGDGEHSGKVLPCHSVKEDGLMRITPATLQALLSGAYDAQVASYRVIDCRFAYEYEGGHIKGAINLNKDEDIERFLFDEAGRRGELPPPSQSGTPGSRQPVLVFHCEFSAKRGPTFAKHFRAKDRSRNLAEYPKLHYPELYILEGGYCSYFSAYPETCDPIAYVQMDAPQHSQARAADLGQFRRWNRARSYTFGDTQGSTQSLQGVKSSGSADSGLFSRNPLQRVISSTEGNQRRGNSFHSLHTLEEAHSQLEEAERQAIEQTIGYVQADHQQEEEASEGASESVIDDVDAFLDDDGEEPTSPSPCTAVEEQQLFETQQEEEDDDDDFGPAESSPCVTAEMKRGKNRGKQFFGRAFKPLAFGKPFGLSIAPPGHSRA